MKVPGRRIGALKKERPSLRAAYAPNRTGRPRRSDRSECRSALSWTPAPISASQPCVYHLSPPSEDTTVTTSSRAAAPPPKRTKKAAPKAAGVGLKPAGTKLTRKSATSIAIATELAPAVAIALLDKTKQPPGADAPALDCLAAGAAPSQTAGKVRVQLMFENGAVLPVEMSNAAGAALSKGLSEELPKK